MRWYKWAVVTSPGTAQQRIVCRSRWFYVCVGLSGEIQDRWSVRFGSPIDIGIIDLVTGEVVSPLQYEQRQAT